MPAKKTKWVMRAVPPLMTFATGMLALMSSGEGAAENATPFDIAMAGVIRNLGTDLLVRVSAEGTAEEVLVNPETDVARCLAAEVRKGTSVRPPRPSYWVRI